MRILVVGNCQIISAAKCISVANPELRAYSRLNPTGADFQKSIDEFDLVYVNSSQPGYFDGLSESAASKIRRFPTIAFQAFHPDLVYVSNPGTVTGPTSHYHSVIVLAAFLRDLSISQTAALFCEELFQHFGFFDYWDSSASALLDEGNSSNLPLDDLIMNWKQQGCFMYSVNHPKLAVTATIVEQMLSRDGLAIRVPHAERFVVDHLQRFPIWPVYPEIAERLGLQKETVFFKGLHGENDNFDVLDLEAFIKQSFEVYRPLPKDGFVCSQDLTRFLTLFDSRPVRANRSAIASNPYSALSSQQFWKPSVGQIPKEDVDPVFGPMPRIETGHQIATAGSCFAQHISAHLKSSGFDFLDAEPAPSSVLPSAAADFGYGLFSARYGNIYTARQLLQLLDRATGSFIPRELPWSRPDGRYADPFRPQIHPQGFATEELLEDDRKSHLACVLKMFRSLDVFIFTLGLTEAWRSKHDGAVFPLAPGVTAGEWDPKLYEFVNFRVDEVVADLTLFLRTLKEVNGTARVILTVSPVPLIATYEQTHVLAATTYSKSVLRVAAEEIVRGHSNVSYFPSFEIITGNFNRGSYYADDLRSITSDGVNHVMRLFTKHCTAKRSTQAKDFAKLFNIVCEEEQIDISSQRSVAGW
jgi:hypothetical protein